MGLHASAPPDKIFQSTLSSRRATKSSAELAETKRFQSTLSSRRATDGDLVITLSAGISIHALLTESDAKLWLCRSPVRNFNPRSPHGERRNCRPFFVSPNIFQSTLSSRRATPSARPGIGSAPDFNPRSPHGERHRTPPKAVFPRGISIHALLTESDWQRTFLQWRHSYFNPRSPHGERPQIPPNWPYRFCLKCQF